MRFTAFIVGALFERFVKHLVRGEVAAKQGFNRGLHYKVDKPGVAAYQGRVCSVNQSPGIVIHAIRPCPCLPLLAITISQIFPAALFSTVGKGSRVPFKHLNKVKSMF